MIQCSQGDCQNNLICLLLGHNFILRIGPLVAGPIIVLWLYRPVELTHYKQLKSPGQLGPKSPFRTTTQRPVWWPGDLNCLLQTPAFWTTVWFGGSKPRYLLDNLWEPLFFI